MNSTLPPLAKMLDLLPDAVCVVDADGRLLFVSEGFTSILGYAPDDVVGRPIFEFIHPDDRDGTQGQARQVMAGTPQRHFHNRYLHRDGHYVDLQWSARWVQEYGVRIGVAREVTELRRAEADLQFRATHDPLTGLPNRDHLQHALRVAIGHARQSDGGLALLYLDLDGFKAINDTGGHDIGDQVLKAVAKRLQDGLRQGDLVARVGGDEFVVLLPGCSDPKIARVIASDLRARLHTPYDLTGGPVHLDASVGIACFPVDGADPQAMLMHADRAMYVAKRQQSHSRSVAPFRADRHGD